MSLKAQHINNGVNTADNPVNNLEIKQSFLCAVDINKLNSRAMTNLYHWFIQW